MTVFEKRTRIEASPARVFAFHERPDALALLTPPWEHTRIISKDPGLAVGVRTELETRIGPLRQRIVAVHVAYEQGRMFRDEMEEGPFARWTHTHSMDAAPEGGCWLVDHVEYALPLGALGALGGGWFVRRKLERLFAFRHEVTKKTCEASSEVVVPLGR